MEHYSVTGMSCAACSSTRGESRVSSSDGVTRVYSQPYLTNSMACRRNSGTRKQIISGSRKMQDMGPSQKGKCSRTAEQMLRQTRCQKTEDKATKTLTSTACVTSRCFFASVDVPVDGTHDVGPGRLPAWLKG